MRIDAFAHTLPRARVVDDVEVVIADEATKRAVYEGNARRVLRLN